MLIISEEYLKKTKLNVHHAQIERILANIHLQIWIVAPTRHLRIHNCLNTRSLFCGVIRCRRTTRRELYRETSYVVLQCVNTAYVWIRPNIEVNDTSVKGDSLITIRWHFRDRCWSRNLRCPNDPRDISRFLEYFDINFLTEIIAI